MSEDRKAWEKEQRGNRIIDMAQAIFFKNGYEFTTIIEIAKASGYNKRSIYLYFKDKEEIFLAVVLRGLTQLHKALAEASRDESLQGLGRAFFEFSLEHPDYLRLIMVYEANTCVYNPGTLKDMEPGSYKSLCQQKTDAIADLITRLLAQGIEKKTIKTCLEPAQLMLLLWGQVFGVMQIILMRQQHFKETYKIGYEDLFSAFMDMTALALSGANPPKAPPHEIQKDDPLK
ncbi:MAG: TetR/AcrR family transcriptional regulator [Proteobacteria bacterium]|nr:TetR/AcrR family transcriptional regulator [Pseudomonadota bacterium]MBU4131137.1 TetR/AcrR family transcriptional regulator [Pseudomonadota bacterium]